MGNFTLKEVPGISGPIKFFILVEDGYRRFDEFKEDIEREGNLSSQLRRIYSVMTEVADLHFSPRRAFKDITPHKEHVKEFEIKTHDLRIYLIKHQGHVIICAGKSRIKKRT